jgi:hypothetical protein
MLDAEYDRVKGIAAAATSDIREEDTDFRISDATDDDSLQGRAEK